MHEGRISQLAAFVSTFLPAVFLIGCVSAHQTAAPPTAAPHTEWTPLFDGETLGAWRPTGFLLPGPVSVDGDTIILGRGDGLTGITWTGEETLPTNNYEISLEASRLDGIDIFCGLTLPVNDSHVSLIIGGWGGTVVGLSNVDSADASENETTVFMSFETDRWYTIRVRVTDDRFRAWIDEELIVDLDTFGRQLDVRPDIGLSRPLGIASWNTTAALRNLRFRRLDR